MGCSFNIDDLDIFIIQEINQKNKSTWEIAKKFYKLDQKEQRELTSKNNLIKKRLKKISQWGIIGILKDKEGKNEYHLFLEYFKLGKHKFIDGYFDSIQLKINDSWVIFQI